MDYFEWWGDLGPVDIDFPDRHFNGWWMVEGRPVTGWNEDLIATYCPDEALCFNYGLAGNSWSVFSPRMRAFMEHAVPGLVQFLPFRLQREDGSGQVLGYCVGQMLRLVDCLDRDRTNVRENWEPINPAGDFGTFRPLFLSERLIGNQRLFRLKGNCLSVIMREDLKNAIEAAGFEGQRFDRIDAS